MDSLAGYLATLAVGGIGTYLSQFLKPKVNVKFWFSHKFTYAIPNEQFQPAPVPALPAANANPAPVTPHFFLLTQSVTIQNFGRESAEWVEIVHRRKPDFFQLYPALAYTEVTSATGEHSLRIESLAAKEYFTIQFLCHTHAPELSYIRTTAGHAKEMPWMISRKFPQWLYTLLLLLMVIGGAFCAYWIIKGGEFILKNVGAFG